MTKPQKQKTKKRKSVTQTHETQTQTHKNLKQKTDYKNYNIHENGPTKSNTTLASADTPRKHAGDTTCSYTRWRHSHRANMSGKCMAYTVPQLAGRGFAPSHGTYEYEHELGPALALAWDASVVDVRKPNQSIPSGHGYISFR